MVLIAQQRLNFPWYFSSHQNVSLLMQMIGVEPAAASFFLMKNPTLFPMKGENWHSVSSTHCCVLQRLLLLFTTLSNFFLMVIQIENRVFHQMNSDQYVGCGNAQPLPLTIDLRWYVKQNSCTYKPWFKYNLDLSKLSAWYFMQLILY